MPPRRAASASRSRTGARPIRRRSARRSSGCTRPTRSSPSSARCSRRGVRREAARVRAGGRRGPAPGAGAAARARQRLGHGPERGQGRADRDRHRASPRSAASTWSCRARRCCSSRAGSTSPRRCWPSSTPCCPRSGAPDLPTRSMADARFFRPCGPFALGELAALAEARLRGGDPDFADPRRRPARSRRPEARSPSSTIPATSPRRGPRAAAACLIRPALADRLPGTVARLLTAAALSRLCSDRGGASTPTAAAPDAGHPPRRRDCARTRMSTPAHGSSRAAGSRPAR